MSFEDSPMLWGTRAVLLEDWGRAVGGVGTVHEERERAGDGLGLAAARVSSQLQ